MVRTCTWSRAIDLRPEGKDERQLGIQPHLRSGIYSREEAAESFQGPEMLGNPLLGKFSFAQIWSLYTRRSQTTDGARSQLVAMCEDAVWERREEVTLLL